MEIIDGINNLTKENLEKINKAILNEELIIFPTETVYGIGALATSKQGTKKIYTAKNRKSNNPLIVHLGNKEDIEKYAYISSDIEKKLIETFMPGPFTLILKKKNNIPNTTSGGLDTIGIRVPSNKIANKILNYKNIPIAAPSANISGKPSGTNIIDIKNEFEGKVKFLIDGNSSEIGLESTVVKVENNIPIILRPGFITKEDIINKIGFCEISPNLFTKNIIKAESPGMMYAHYAPSSPCLLIYNEDINIIKEIIKTKITNNTVIIGSKDLENIPCQKFLNYGLTLEEISHNIFHLLRVSDTYKPDLIIIQGVNKKGLGLAIMNRLIRAANYNYLEKL